MIKKESKRQPEKKNNNNNKATNKGTPTAETVQARR